MDNIIKAIHIKLSRPRYKDRDFVINIQNPEKEIKSIDKQIIKYRKLINRVDGLGNKEYEKNYRDRFQDYDVNRYELTKDCIIYYKSINELIEVGRDTIELTFEKELTLFNDEIMIELNDNENTKLTLSDFINLVNMSYTWFDDYSGGKQTTLYMSDDFYINLIKYNAFTDDNFKNRKEVLIMIIVKSKVNR